VLHHYFSDKETRDNIKKQFVKFVKDFSQHPAILFWAIGNENNYHFDAYLKLELCPFD